MDSIKIKYTANLQEQIKARKLYYKHSFWSYFDKIIALLSIGFGCFLIALWGFSWWLIIFFIIGVFEFFNVLSLDSFIVKFQFKRLPVKFKEEQLVEFNEDVIIYKTAQIDSKLNWSLYYKVIETDEFFMLVYGKNMYSVIPKRAFKNDKEIDQFKQLINSKIRK